MSIAYAVEPDLDPVAFADVLRRTSLGERRPLDRPEQIARMVRGAQLIVTAREAGTLVGVARSVTDFSFCCYLSDLAVDEAFQRRGIGRELIRRTHEAAGLDCTLILRAAPKSIDYYPHIGMKRIENGFVFDRRK